MVSLLGNISSQHNDYTEAILEYKQIEAFIKSNVSFNNTEFENIIKHKTGYFYKNHVYKKFRHLEPAFQGSVLIEDFQQYVRRRNFANGLGYVSIALMTSGIIISSATGIGYVDCESDCGSATGPIIFFTGFVMGPIGVISSFGLRKRRLELLRKHKLMVENLTLPHGKELSLEIAFTSNGVGILLIF